MNASPGEDLARETRTLLARVSRNSERVILPINDSALKKDPPSPAFYCVHPVSGAAGSEYASLARRLDPAVRFYEIQAPPIKMQDPEFGTSVASIADYYIDVLIDFQKSGPLLLGGYSAGAIIALEIAHKLSLLGREVGLLVIVDEAPPQTTFPALRPWNPPYLLELARNLPGWILHADVLKKGAFHSFGRRVSNKVIAFGKAAMGLKRDQRVGGGYALDRILNLSRYPLAQKLFIYRLYAAVVGYVPEKYTGAVVVYEAGIKPLLHLPQVGRKWREIAPRAEIVSITGMHTDMLRDPCVDELAKDMRKRIAKFLLGECDRGSSARMD
jgi:thioesterase domain-containing protein